MDWTKTGYSWDVIVNVVHQTNVDNTIGSLSGVLLNSVQISENYYSDSRIQAKVATVVKENESDGYVDYGRLRIILSIPSRNWTSELITGYVSDKKEVTEHGYTKRTYTVESTIWGLLDHKVKASVTVGKGANLINVWTSLVKDQTKMQYSTSGAQDHAFSSTIIYEAGTSLATILFELTESIDRMDVDGHGRLTIKKYTAPSKQTASKVLDHHNLRGLTLSPLEKTWVNFETPGRAIVTATVSKDDGKGGTTQEVVVGYYDAPKTNSTSIDVRGYLKARSDAYSGVSENPSKSELDAVAKKNWEKSQEDTGAEWSANSVFADYHAGDICTLIPKEHSAGVKVLVKATTIYLSSMTQGLTLKEV